MSNSSKRIYCVNRVKNEDASGQRTAGKKAPDDIAKIVSLQLGGEIIEFEEPLRRGGLMGALAKQSANSHNWRRLEQSLPTGAIVVLQHPYEGIAFSDGRMSRLRRERGIKFIVLIHDLLFLRDNIETGGARRNSGTISQELALFEQADAIICHNSRMAEALADKGIDKSRLVVMGLFDYLCDGDDIPSRKLGDPVVVAGNLSRAKAGYLYALGKDSPSKRINLYGPNWDADNESSGLIHRGVFAPEELPGKLEGSFGLVWDGDVTETCSGPAGWYTQFNCPHKASLYVASGLPLVVWEKAAIAEFVEREGLGIVASTIDDALAKIETVTEDSYSEMAHAVHVLAAEIRAGRHAADAIAKALLMIDGSESTSNCS